MRHPSLIRVLLLLTRFEDKNLALWDKAEPISLDELKAKFAELACNDAALKSDQPSLDSDALTLDQLWKIFESLDELEDCPLIY